MPCTFANINTVRNLRTVKIDRAQENQPPHFPLIFGWPCESLVLLLVHEALIAVEYGTVRSICAACKLEVATNEKRAYAMPQMALYRCWSVLALLRSHSCAR